MASAAVDTTVLYAAGNANAQRHDSALSIVRGADSGDLPELRVPDPILVETINGLTRDVGHATAIDVLDRLRSGASFEVTREPTAVWSTGIELFERMERLSLADGLLVASARHVDCQYVYSFDDDFDGIDGLTRLDSSADPFEP